MFDVLWVDKEEAAKSKVWRGDGQIHRIIFYR
jgi:hypothetical protein